VKAEDQGLDLTDLSPRPESDFSWLGTSDLSSGIAADDHQFDLTEEPAAAMETDDQSLFGLGSEPDLPGTFAVPEVDSDAEPQELSLIDEAFSLVENLEDLEELKQQTDLSVESAPDAEKEADPVPDLPYFDDLFTREPVTDHQPKVDLTPEKTAPSVVHSKPETVFEKEPELPDDPKPALDDKELFGMSSAERAVDRSSFEDRGQSRVFAICP